LTEAAVIVPIRFLETTKIRLAQILSREERRDLSLAMLRKVLSSVERSLASMCVVVSSDPKSVSRLGSEFPKVKLIQESRPAGGVNDAMLDGLKDPHVSAEQKILLMPSDLPLLSPSEIDRVIGLLDKYDAIISPAERLDGTSLLAFGEKNKIIPFHYDDQSYVKHLEELRLAKRNYLVLSSDGFSRDLDNPADLERMFKIFQVSTFPEFLDSLRRSSC
jgi:2-phospho-L-lactate guanylyltransferase